MSLRARNERGQPTKGSSLIPMKNSYNINNLVAVLVGPVYDEIASYLAMTGLFILFLKSIQSFGLLISIKSTQASTTVFTKVNIIPDISQ